MRVWKVRFPRSDFQTFCFAVQRLSKILVDFVNTFQFLIMQRHLSYTKLAIIPKDKLFLKNYVTEKNTFRC